jgi:flagellar basal body rod protein FlgG/antibiotic biosynthesis monooxygenase (ABM) superfamily enzyme
MTLSLLELLLSTNSSLRIRRGAVAILASLFLSAMSIVIAATLIATVGCGSSSAPGGGSVGTATFSPTSGAVGTMVTITGADFSSTQSVSIGNIPAILVSESTSSLVALVMPGATSGGVSVTTPAGTYDGKGTFTVTATGVPGTQQGNKLTGSGNVSPSQEGYSVAVSADGNTALVGAPNDNSGVGAAWVFVRAGTSWTQQGNKLVGNGTGGNQGFSVALSADGNTALVGGPYDNSNVGAAWVFTRSGSTWTQQGNKLVGNGAVGNAWQGSSVALSADGNTALVGGPQDSSSVGAVWVFTRSGSGWTQLGNKLVGTGYVLRPAQGATVALSSDGSTALIGGFDDDSDVGAAWVFVRSGTSWTQQGNKLVGTGAVGMSQQGTSVALSAGGNTALIGGSYDNSGAGAAWVFTRSGTSWVQQGNKLVGSGAISYANQGDSAALSADGNTAIVGSRSDAAWIFTRSGSSWIQSGNALVGTGEVGVAIEGFSVAISADGNTALTGGPNDNSSTGAAWVFTP